ncbi:MAG: hypothetical protein H7328_05700 [Bdellovibrio sp.]|nr:hypothetical protein [Bdellovibrio sp.]
MIKKWNEKVEKMFEQPNNTVDFEELKKSYHITSDNQQLENISYIFSSVVKKEDIALLFTQLSSFFEVGFMLEKTSSTGLCTASQIFAYSKHLSQLDGLKTIRLPNADLFQVMKTNAISFLTKFGLEHLDSEKKMTGFFVRLTQNHSFVVMSALAEPWLQLRIESLQKTLMRVHFDS